MELGICLKGDIDVRRTVALAHQAEAAGFDYMWFADSHVLWSDVYTQMAVCLNHTKRLRVGPLVTNPRVREWSVAASIFARLVQIGGGRLDLGVGRGDSSVRVMGRRPATLKQLTAFCAALRTMLRGEACDYEGAHGPVRLDWADPCDVPIWIAGYGPRALAAAGAHGDGLVIQLADPGLCRWMADQAIAARTAAGLDADGYRVLACAPAWIGDRESAIAETSWFPAVVGNHVADIVERHGADSGLVPESLTAFIARRRGRGADEGYDYLKHAVAGSDNVHYVTDAITESFCVIGPPEAHVEKIRALEAAGVTQFGLYLMTGEQERLVGEYAARVMPHLR
jgi:probable F420-dependent oxidoreductase